MFAKITKNKIHLKALVYTLELLALGLAIYLVFLPFYPLLKYGVEDQSPPAQTQNLEVAVKEAKDFKNTLPASEYDVSPNRLIISKIGVNAPIVESKNADYGLSRGAWRVPETSTPDKGGNTVITGHRFKYLPPNNLTFYLLDKMEPQDIITVLWQDKEYFYRVSQKKIISPDQTQILNATKEPVLTLYTCDPVYSQKNRLVVVAELIED